MNGATVEDITELSRVESQLSMFLSTQKKQNLGACGTGWHAGIDALASTSGLPETSTVERVFQQQWGTRDFMLYALERKPKIKNQLKILFCLY